jgi:hypothetical protein
MPLDITVPTANSRVDELNRLWLMKNRYNTHLPLAGIMSEIALV